jgi:hypothetical protein
MRPSAPRLSCAALLLLLPLSARSDAPPEAPAPRPVAGSAAKGAPELAPAPREAVAIPRRHALIMCGHPGDAAHAKSFAETVGKLREGLTRTVGIHAERQHVLFGSEMPKDMPGATGPATKEAVAAAVAEVRKNLRPDDGLWVICLGHGHHDGKQAQWCLPGPDLSAAEFGKLFAGVNCREQVFVMTHSLSGYFIAPLAKRDRVVIAATEADAETNETTFPAVFAKALATGFDPAEHDIDKDGRITLFDLFVVTAKEIAQSYAGAEQVATEHAQLDDDGDGVGHELQNAYLPEEQGGTPPGKKANKRPHRDGVRAAQIPLLTGK